MPSTLLVISSNEPALAARPSEAEWVEKSLAAAPQSGKTHRPAGRSRSSLPTHLAIQLPLPPSVGINLVLEASSTRVALRRIGPQANLSGGLHTLTIRIPHQAPHSDDSCAMVERIKRLPQPRAPTFIHNRLHYHPSIRFLRQEPLFSSDKGENTVPHTTPVLDLNLQIARAKAFAALHQHAPLVLPNAWDAGTARLIENEGAKAIATTSGGRSWSLGLPDGNGLNRQQALDLIREIAGIATVPVTADFETGYGDTLDELKSSITEVLTAGAVGINLEDSGQHPLYAPEDMAARITAVREASDAFGVPLFINARTDVYLAHVGEESGRLADAINRAKVYTAAGANGIFIPGVYDLETLRALAAAIELPINVILQPDGPTVAEFVDAGITRISAGSAIVRSIYAHVQRAARELLTTGAYTSLADAIPYGAINAEFKK